MEWLILIAAGVLLYWWWSARRRRTTAHREPWHGRQWRDTGDPADRPEGDRFKNWDEAFNRPVSGERFLIEYADENGEVSEREIEPESIHLIRNSPTVYIRAFCHLRNDQRTFRNDRVLAARNLRTGRQIGDLGQYLRGRH